VIDRCVHFDVPLGLDISLSVDCSSDEWLIQYGIYVGNTGVLYT